MYNNIMDTTEHNFYEKERLENISRIMPTYASFLRVGDEVSLGLRDDPLYPYSDTDRPQGTIESIFGPEGNQVINVKLDDKFGGKIAHCDVRTLNPYLSFDMH